MAQTIDIIAKRLPALARMRNALTFPDLRDEVMGDWDCTRGRIKLTRRVGQS